VASLTAHPPTVDTPSLTPRQPLSTKLSGYRHGWLPGPAPSDRNIQVIVEIEARAVTVERLSMVSERQGWTFGETLEYALDALELAMAKTARIPSDPLRPRPPRR